jgi:hypothetical protein
VDIDEFRALFYGWRKKNPVLVCSIEPALSRLIRATHPRVLISWATIEKQKREHPELRSHEYEVLPHLIETGLVVQDTGLTLVIAQSHPVNYSPIYKTVIKATTMGDAIYISSFHRIEPRKIRNIRRRGIIVRDVEIVTGTSKGAR